MKNVISQLDRYSQPLTRTQQKEVDDFVGSLTVERVIDMVGQLVVMFEPIASPVVSHVRKSPRTKSVRKTRSVKQTKKS
jgi:hypothetical protein